MSAPVLARSLAARVAHLPAAPAPTEALPPAAVVIEGAAAALDADKTKYTDRPGVAPLRAGIAAHLATLGVRLSAADVTITCGIIEARFVTLTVLGNGGVPDLPALAGLRSGADFGAVRYIHADDPHAHAVVASLPAEQSLVWELGEVMAPHPLQKFPELAPRVVTIGRVPGFDDGWQVGWLAGHADHSRLRAYKQSATICSVSVSQWAAAALMEAQS